MDIFIANTCINFLIFIGNPPQISDVVHEELDSIGTSRGTEKQDRNPHEGELQSESC